jgi:hypothetical protein
LTLKRLVLRKMTLAPASGAGGLPRLLPLGLFHEVPRSLSLYDVRMVVDDKMFAEYLAFFRSQLRSSRDATPGPSIVTVSRQQCSWGPGPPADKKWPACLWGVRVCICVLIVSQAALLLLASSISGSFCSCGEVTAGRRAGAVGAGAGVLDQGARQQQRSNPWCMGFVTLSARPPVLLLLLLPAGQLERAERAVLE